MYKLLLVDDNEDVLFVCTRLIEKKFGAEVVATNSGKSAINILKNDQSFDAIISDYNMQNGTGLELLNFKLSKSIECPFYFYTDEFQVEIPYSSTSFIGVFSKMKFENLLTSLELILQKRKV